MTSHWTIRLAHAAERDFLEILRWTATNFGSRQSKTYARTLSAALHDLASGPKVTGAKNRDDIGDGIHILHVARKGRKGRHFVVFRIAAASGGQLIDVLRILHDSMDLPRHLPNSSDDDVASD